MSIFALLIGSAIGSNIILFRGLGIHSSIINKNTIIPVSIMVSINTLVLSIVLWLLNSIVILEYFNTIILVGLNMLFSYIWLYLLKQFKPVYYEKLGLEPSMLLLNSSILGIPILGLITKYDFLTTLVFTLGSVVGYIVISYIFNSLISELNNDPIPRNLRGIPLFLIVLGIMAHIFSRF